MRHSAGISRARKEHRGAQTMRKLAGLQWASMAILAGHLCQAEGKNDPVPPAEARSSVKANALRDAYYGDLHLHTNYSFDAALVAAASVNPDEAYRFAKGEAVQ